MKSPWPFIGNEHLGELLLNLQAAGQLPQAMAFVGPTGLGKTTAAQWFVQRDICRQTDAPCGRCDDCRQFVAGAHQRAHSIQTEDAGSIKIETVRAGLDRFAYVFDARAWLIIPDADRLTESAQNILLKFLEEPPPQVHILLTLPDIHAVRPTVASRLSLFRWHRVSPTMIRKNFPAASTEDMLEADGRPGRLTTILGDPERQQRRLQAAQSLIDQTLVPPVELDDEAALERHYQSEEQILRRWLHQAIGLTSTASPSPWPLGKLIQRLAVYADRRDRNWRTVTARTLYSHLHVA